MMRIVAFFMPAKLPAAPTGGNRVNARLMDAWASLARISFVPVRYRKLLLRRFGLAFFFSRSVLRDADIVFQDATTGFSSGLLISLCRRFYPATRHVGIVYHPQWFVRPELKERECRFFNAFDCLITISEHVRDALRNEGIQRPIHLLTPGRARMPARTTPQADPPLILWNGHLAPAKGPFVLLEALAQLRNAHWQALFIAAAPPSKVFDRQFHAIMRAMDPTIRERIQVCERLPIAQYRDQFFRASIFCLPSYAEGYSISTAEAMACGCAAVVPRTENFVELIGTSDYAGFFAPNDAQYLARVLDRLLSDGPLRESAAAYCLQRSALLPDWEQFRADACDLLRSRIAPAIRGSAP